MQLNELETLAQGSLQMTVMLVLEIPKAELPQSNITPDVSQWVINFSESFYENTVRN